MSDMELLQERYELATKRIREIAGEYPEKVLGLSLCETQEHYSNSEQQPKVRKEKIMQAEALADYFTRTAGFLIQMEETWDWVEKEKIKQASLEECKAQNQALYWDILPKQYAFSYANPAYAVQKLGESFGRLLSFLYYELRSVIGFVYEHRLEAVVIRMELFVEIYGVFACEWQEKQVLPEYETIRKILYWYAFDYADIAAQERVQDQVDPKNNFAARILQTADYNDPRYLFWYGEYVTDNELEMAVYMASLDQADINLMADTYTEGYRTGFVLGHKDLSRKKTVELRYSLGFERMMGRAVKNFAAMGLQPVICRAAYSILHNPTLNKNGFLGANPNKQYDFDHKDDRALFLDKAYLNRRLEVLRTAYEKFRAEARLYAGPAVVETFGEARWEPLNKPECIKMTKEQQELWVEYRSQAGQIQRDYIPEEERSFTIIAFPVPKIGERFPEIFREIIRINTLDPGLYRKLQQNLIDVLDHAQTCEIKGMNGNCTDIKVRLASLSNPEKETIFENCVADVNIPVGEVFTSPVLKGTCGMLHVKRVFLNGLEYHDLKLVFEDGMVKDYSCSNFGTEEENSAFIRENILFHHKSLPLGEFAIGTNTTAYAVAGKYGIEDKLPILIAEKMGPHFAVGDTCYSHAEDIAVFNPDGKEIIARDNEVSALRDTEPGKAYFNCHTDITIPYDELGELTAVGADGSRTTIIAQGRFVLTGCGEWNRPLT